MLVRPSAVVLVLLIIGVAAAPAEEPVSLFSGPQVGEKLPALNVSLAYGKDAGQTVDLIQRAAGRPTLLVIVNGPNRPAARLTRILMNYAEMHEESFFAGVVYLDNDQSAAEQYLRRATSWWGVGALVGVSIDGGEGPGSYGLNRNVNLTVLVADKGRVAANVALVQPSETDAPKILEAVVTLTGDRLPTAPELSFLSAPTRKPSPNVGWRSAPSDPQLRELLCAALAAEDQKQARLKAAALEEYVGNDADRRAMLGNAAALLLGDRGRVKVGDLPIVEQLQKWRTEFDPLTETDE